MNGGIPDTLRYLLATLPLDVELHEPLPIPSVILENPDDVTIAMHPANSYDVLT